MAPNLKSLFGIKNSSNSESYSTNIVISPDAKGKDEGYPEYGKKLCGLSNGSPDILPAYLHKIYTTERQNQINDTQTQQAKKNTEIEKLNQITREISGKKAEIDLTDNHIAQCKENVREYSGEIEELKTSNGMVNKNSLLKLAIGSLILIILTLYLFIFYSSTFYSAFFKDFLASENIGIGDAIFDAQAISHSLASGVGQMLFVLSAPIIFLGLGFALHYFSQEEGKGKFFKIVAIIIVTFIFDCILAYGIAKKMYDLMALSSLEDLPPYTLNDAFSDSHVWTVIFCGFVVYIIWGIVFSMTMSAYENLKSNKSAIAALKNKIIHEKEKCTNLENIKIKLASEMDSLKKEQDAKQRILDNGVFINFSDIKVSLNDFFTGWNSLLVPLGKSPKVIQLTSKIFEETVNSLIPNTNNTL